MKLVLGICFDGGIERGDNCGFGWGNCGETEEITDE